VPLRSWRTHAIADLERHAIADVADLTVDGSIASGLDHHVLGLRRVGRKPHPRGRRAADHERHLADIDRGQRTLPRLAHLDP
jgi:hypothetical protein